MMSSRALMLVAQARKSSTVPPMGSAISGAWYPRRFRCASRVLIPGWSWRIAAYSPKVKVLDTDAGDIASTFERCVASMHNTTEALVISTGVTNVEEKSCATMPCSLSTKAENSCMGVPLRAAIPALEASKPLACHKASARGERQILAVQIKSTEDMSQVYVGRNRR
ncbi:hypothetical protein CPELA_00445 [Corynebacterium pelargi]|uniref:Uncharacterized protein n=1 Tax=Corynebacterium pelargi TaxID=1471400 RepID=A0A410W618_9CORY|nr:hypothetical protein CPELA_00445 [Corynebacterium pelargi]